MSVVLGHPCLFWGQLSIVRAPLGPTLLPSCVVLRGDSATTTGLMGTQHGDRAEEQGRASGHKKVLWEKSQSCLTWCEQVLSFCPVWRQSCSSGRAAGHLSFPSPPNHCCQLLPEALKAASSQQGFTLAWSTLAFSHLLYHILLYPSQLDCQHHQKVGRGYPNVTLRVATWLCGWAHQNPAELSVRN